VSAPFLLVVPRTEDQEALASVGLQATVPPVVASGCRVTLLGGPDDGPWADALAGVLSSAAERSVVLLPAPVPAWLAGQDRPVERLREVVAAASPWAASASSPPPVAEEPPGEPEAPGEAVAPQEAPPGGNGKAVPEPEPLLDPEQAVLSSCLRSEQAVRDVLDVLTTEMFASTGHALVYRAILDVLEDTGTSDPVLVGRRLAERGDLQRVPDLPALVAYAPSPVNARLYAEAVVRAWRRRQTRAVGLELVHAVETDPGHADDWAEDAVTRLVSLGDSSGTRTSLWRSFTVMADASERDPREWLVPGVVPFASLVLLIGTAKKAGKSTFAWGLLAAAHHGSMFLGHCVPKTRALVLAEDGDHDLADRLARFRLDGAVPCIVPRSALRGPPDLAALTREAVRRAKEQSARILLVDTFGFWADLEAQEENDAACVVQKLRPLQAAADAGLAVVLVHHPSKRTDVEGGMLARGSSAFAGTVEATLELRRQPDSPENRRLVHMESRFAGVKDFLVELVDRDAYHEPDRFDLVGDAGVVERKDVEEAVLAWLDANPGPHRRDEIADGVGKRTRDVRNLVPRLVTQAKVVRTGLGVAGNPYLYHTSESQGGPGGSGGGSGRGEADGGSGPPLTGGVRRTPLKSLAGQFQGPGDGTTQPAGTPQRLCRRCTRVLPDDSLAYLCAPCALTAPEKETP
jgi:hypothetical protein